MTSLQPRILIPLAVLCLLAAVTYGLLRRNPYRRLDYFSDQVLRLATHPRYNLNDHLHTLFHKEMPYQYYAEQSMKEQKALLVSGRLIITPISIPESWSKPEVVAALRKTSGMYWAVAEIDNTNHVVRLICKPHQAACFRQVLEHE
jgi:hypothetical protein